MDDRGMFPIIPSDFLAVVVFSLAVVRFFPPMPTFLLFVASWLLFATPLLARTARLLRERRFLDENFLLLLASLAALFVERSPEAMAILLIYRLGRFLQERVLSHVAERCRRLRSFRDDGNSSSPAENEQQSDLAEINRLISQASSRKTRAVRFAARFAQWYTPLVVFAAFFIAFLPLLGLGEMSLTESVYHAALFLVLACPAVLLVAIPLAEWVILTTLTEHGILGVKEEASETLARTHTFVIVMNGILTYGIKEVREILPEEGMSKKRLLTYAAIAEAEATHPVAVAIREAFGKPIPYGSTEEILSEPGGGVVVSYEGREIAVGSSAFLRKLGVEPGPEATIGTTVQVALDRFFIGRIVVGDEPYPENKTAIARLKRAGIKQVVVLSGDNPLLVERFARKAGADRGIGGLSPAEKVQALEQIIAQAKGPVAVAGHAFDDAPLIARADVGIAAGGVPAKWAIETADMVITGPGPLPLAFTIETVRKGRQVMLQNLALALWVKGSLLICATLGIAPLWAIFSADTLAATVLLLNTTRIAAGASRYRRTFTGDAS